MKRKLLIILLILFVLSVAIGTSPIVDYFYSLGAEAELSTAMVGTASDTVSVTSTDVSSEADVIRPETVWFAIGLSSLTVIVCFIVYLRKRRV